ncbi:NAD(P)H-dependent oxidoreductase [Salinibius halmophilus]|uniref:NAD(P)H-dependent oxidoreductase n=1 Tax=Salinibius halmophilus TaxID=1853216 RepID=UPI000E6634E3|nr:NAD(P)H-dependent oxidoreductase [Salinibius halmophilus]
MKNILVLNANPKTDSLNKSLAATYAKAAQAKHHVQVMNIGELTFDSNLQQGYEKIQPLETDLVTLQTQLKWANHVVIITPVWWGTVPAVFKGALDRILLPGFAFKYEAGKLFPKKLLEGKTSELIITLDTPAWWYKLVQGNVVYRHLKRTVLGFVGIKNKRSKYFGPVISAKPKTIAQWHTEVERLGATC